MFRFHMFRGLRVFGVRVSRVGGWASLMLSCHVTLYYRLGSMSTKSPNRPEEKMLKDLRHLG